MQWSQLTLLIDMIQVCATVATLIVLCIYTYQTVKLAKAAERQYQIAFRPIVYLVLEYEPGDYGGQTKFGAPMVLNVGYGPALNVRVPEFIVEDYAFWVLPVNVLLANGKEKVRIVYRKSSQERETTDCSEISVPLAGNTLSQKVIGETRVNFVVEYEDISGKKYLSDQEFVKDEQRGVVIARLKGLRER